MYVGITGGKSFPLKHFLSGNWFQFSTWLSNTELNISKRLLDIKINRLHLFQCLMEAQSNYLVSSFERFFEGQVIDLVSQTLIPCDLNTLGFVLIRSINKQWKLLNLSRCNIGDTGCTLLYERFLDKDTQNIVKLIFRLIN